MKHEQKIVPLPIQFPLYDRLNKEQIQLLQNCEYAKEELKQLLANVTISPTLLTQLFQSSTRTFNYTYKVTTLSRRITNNVLWCCCF